MWLKLTCLQPVTTFSDLSDYFSGYSVVIIIEKLTTDGWSNRNKISSKYSFPKTNEGEEQQNNTFSILSAFDWDFLT